jgi:AcrR family transcriptional regulator
LARFVLIRLLPSRPPKMHARSAKPGHDQKPSGPGRPRSEVAAQAILSAALALFIEQGIDGASIEQIAKNAGVARTTVYRRWESKEELIAEAIAAARGVPEREAIASRVPLGRLGERLSDALVEAVTAPNYRKVVARLVGSLPSCPELMAVYWELYLLPRREIVRHVLERARAAGLIRPEADAETLLDLIGGALMYHLLIRPGERTSTEMLAYLLKVFQELGLSDATPRKHPTRKRTATR